MKLITKEILKMTPPILATEGIDSNDKLVTAKYFAGGLTWYMVEYDPENKIAFGYVQNHVDPSFSEWGDFSIWEFEEYNKGNNFPFIERDLHFKPQKIRELKLPKAW
jgi:hypothetical protein